MTPHSPRFGRRRACQLQLLWPQLRLLLVTLLLLPCCLALGGEKAFFKTPQMTPNVTHRQNVCDRYDAFRNGTVGLKDALEGMKLHVLMSNYDGAFFSYHEERGIHPDYPGLMPVILDELARRGKFTWRDSFGISTDPGDSNATWTELLIWGIETYDINADWWAQNLDRMNMGVAFLKEWYDSSIVLISKELPEEISDEINFWNWTNPYDGRVWLTTIFTIIVSGIVYQLLEWFADERQDRSMWEWFQHDLYLSAINFTQAYEYQPKTFATRLFGISMAVWALVMTATYTANLASLLVDRKPPPVVLTSIEEIAVFGKTLCTWAGTNADTYIRDTYPKAIRIEKTSLKDLYDGVHNGECDFLVESLASWNKHKAIREYNPYCDLFWVGGDRKIREVEAGFASKADSGTYCTGLIRDVINLHMHDMIGDDFIAQAWEREYKKTQDIDCNTYRPELYTSEEYMKGENSTDRRLRAKLYQKCGKQQNSQLQRGRRELKGAGKGAAGGAVASIAASAGGDGEAQKLKLEQMMGTFVLHWGLMAIAVIIGGTHALYKKHFEDPTDARYSDASVVRSTKRTETPSSGDEFDEFDSTLLESRKSKPISQSIFPQPSQKEMDLQKQLAAMRLSQTQMQDFQRDMLEEQRNLKLQIQALVQVVSRGQNNGALNSASPNTNTCSLLSGDMPSDVESTA